MRLSLLNKQLSLLSINTTAKQYGNVNRITQSHSYSKARVVESCCNISLSLSQSRHLHRLQPKGLLRVM